MPQFIRDQTAIDAIRRSFHSTRGIPAEDVAALETAIHHGTLTHEHFAKLHGHMKEIDPANTTLLSTLERFATPPADYVAPVDTIPAAKPERKPSRKPAPKKAAVKRAPAKKQAIKVKPKSRKR